MLPDVVIPMFTANYQSLFGIRDIMNFIQSSRQRLAVDRMTLTILPLPSRFGTRVEFKESQEWLDRIADILKNCFSDWLPKWIEPRYMLEQIKIPQVDYFSFGEKLAVVEQGTNDPEGMGFIYSKIADFISSDFTDIENFVGKNYFEEKKSYYHYTKELKATEEKKEKKYNYDLFISYPRSVYQWVREVMLPTLTEYLGDELGYKPQIYFDAGEMVPGNDWNDTFKAALEGSKVFIFVFSDSELSSNFLNSDLLVAEAIQKTLKTNILFPVLFRKGYGELNLPPSIFKIQPVDLSSFSKEAITGSTKLNAQFGNVIEQFVQTLASSIREIDKKDQNVIPTEKDIHVEIESLAYAYENLRKQMPSGNTRTRLMQDIVEKMKSKASEAELILPSLTNSSSPGKRLAAIAILQEKPKIEYVDWLADHTGDNEKPFVGYQSSVGIYLASRNLIDKKALSGAIDRAFENVDKYPYKDPNQISVLESAKAQLSFKS
jgi:hypothetical protein